MFCGEKQSNEYMYEGKSVSFNLNFFILPSELRSVEVDLTELSVNVSSPVQVNCRGDSEPRSEVHWELGTRTGTTVPMNLTGSSEVGVTLIIEHAQAEDSGVILCAAENVVGRAEARFTLSVFCKFLLYIFIFSVTYEFFLLYILCIFLLLCAILKCFAILCPL